MKRLYIGLLLLLSSISYTQIPCPGLDSLNYGNQWYHTVQIHSQCWFKENLNIGIMRSAVNDQINNDTLEKFCYNNDSNMCNTYGGLYQWREAVQYTFKITPRGICPFGWHIPSDVEFDTLISSVGGDGNALKQIGQGQGTNTSGFSALLAGDNEYASFHDIGINANIWSSNNIFDPNMGSLLGSTKMIWNDIGINFINLPSAYGMSVRCIRDGADLILHSPYGGENWLIGSSHSINWGGNIISNSKIKIEYSIDNGISWLMISESVSAQDGSYTWNIPNSPSKYCKVRLTDLNNPNSVSLNNVDFTIKNDPCLGQSTIKHDDKTYNTIVIDGKCWFKDNLNSGIMIPGSQSSVTNGLTEKYCYNDDTANCSIYGGLYSLSEIMEPKICPTFWHIFSDTEFEILADNILYDANALKAVGQGYGYGTGTNTTGFSLLLAGYRWNDGSFQALGSTAYLPTYRHYIFNNVDNINNSDATPTTVGGSMRCVMDDLGPLLLKSPFGGENWLIGSTQKISWSLSDVINIKIDYTTDNGTSWINIIPSISASLGSYNWIIPNTPSKNSKVKISSVMNPDTNSISNNTFRIYKVSTDSCPGIPTINYAGQIYNTIAIGDQCWLKENLNVGTMINASQDQSNNGILEKYCYNNDSTKCSIYGGLYQWNEAMQYNTVENAKGICPDGWHIPSWSNFVDLLTHVDNIENDLLEVGQGSGTNASGFSALLSGSCGRGTFTSLENAFYWNSTNYDESNAFYSILFSHNIINEGGVGNKIAGSSIRCINDNKISNVPTKPEVKPPANFELSNAYPNPWNPTTTIRYQVPIITFVTIKVFDALGREVSTLVNEEKQAGSYEITLNGRNLSSGVYYYQMKAGNFTDTKKLILIK